MGNTCNRLCAGLLLIASFAATAQVSSDPIVNWAYPWLSPSDAIKSQVNPAEIRHVPDSNIVYSQGQTVDYFLAPDWHPDEHPKMPPIVKVGRKPSVFACGFCHRADGSGGPENASINGLSADYIVEQVKAFQSGKRKAAVAPDKGPGSLMRGVVESINDDEINSAAAYFAAIKPRRNIDVVQAEFIPSIAVNVRVFSHRNNQQKEPLGNRIIELANNDEQFENRDTRTQFTAYVPIGSIQRGQRLAQGLTGGKTRQCATCHGPELKGTDAAPRIAGRSPSYLARQLVDIKYGSRTGAEVGPMLVVVEQLTSEDILALTAYVSSLSP